MYSVHACKHIHHSFCKQFEPAESSPYSKLRFIYCFSKSRHHQHFARRNFTGKNAQIFSSINGGNECKIQFFFLSFFFCCLHLYMPLIQSTKTAVISGFLFQFSRPQLLIILFISRNWDQISLCLIWLMCSSA